ncbi:response regulator transcription factor [Mycolicibacterium holsaticum]|uniref:response regulator transcription factor n=1 Tax=Mycolicibacterium holsaticum TaxID=152142 RepID=UPI001C7CC9D3|nr:response regulator transcription factor [Mycolicibacterium holsaticum]QZA15233.1 response regulator transcription factor [Mycolicibacterium holsaticum DSM 44478 = JCM 12374]UNC12495.1 response regulator transcription factor [Mycolicibacterium holsaticum DSM 44478 = JCM 12374]
MVTRLDVSSELLIAARSAHGRRDWRAAYEAFTQAAEDTSLGVDDLDAMATAAWRLGHGKESLRVAERVFTQLARTDPPSAAMKAVDVALGWLTRGDVNIGQGWMNRARRLLEGAPAGPTHAYLAYLDAVVAVRNRDTAVIGPRVSALRELCGRLDSPALTALSHVAEGLEAMLDGRMAEAYSLIDEAMLPVLADQVPLDWAGDIYCIVLHHCHRLADLPRMRSWTQSMERWCRDFAASITYGGVCDVHRLQLLAGTDDYTALDARLDQTSRALEEVNSWAAGEGYYQLGEVRRLRRDADGALAAFARARELGVEPQPGEALLHCHLGDGEIAWTNLRVALAGEDRLGRMRLLFGAVEVALSRDDIDEAERHCQELESGAAAFGTPGFRAWAAHARGAVLVRRAQHAHALEVLEGALREYRVQQCRYETAQVYEWMSVAHRGLGEQDLAAADAATAENIYAQLGVESSQCASPLPGGLTRREIDILRRVASGGTNKQVAEQICISEKTVGRHLANIYGKLGVSSRTAAVAWAHEQNLLH